VRRYLSGYAEPELAHLDHWPEALQFDQVMVIPACKETDQFLHRVPSGEDRVLLILVINQGPGATPQVNEQNRQLADQITNSFEPVAAFRGTGNLGLFRHVELGYHCLLVDRFSTGRQMPPREGVGLARKIGADLACALIEKGIVASPWIHNTDADTRLPTDYFRRSQSFAGKASALLYPFTHIAQDDQEIARATALYEFGLRHYELGLRKAGSPYAFQTVGSAFAVHVLSYAQVRGFPKREAAEDFYMLNKLAKVGRIEELDGQPIQIESRTSDRVPFGTGAGVGKILGLDNAFKQYRFYNPRSFEYLGYWLDMLGAGIWQAVDHEKLFDTIVNDCPESFDRPLLADALTTTGAPKALAHALKQSKSQTQFLKHMHDAFDAFRTRKLIHYIRDRAMPELTLDQLLDYPGYREQIGNNPAMDSILRKSLYGP
jgi:hypothetical protein